MAVGFFDKVIFERVVGVKAGRSFGFGRRLTTEDKWDKTQLGGFVVAFSLEDSCWLLVARGKVTAGANTRGARKKRGKQEAEVQRIGLENP